jgi:hypothetical protein
MRFFISMAMMAMMAITVTVAAVPITPAAPELQRLAEQLRSEGVEEVCTIHTNRSASLPNMYAHISQHDITKQLSLPSSQLSDSLEPSTRPFLHHVTDKFHGFFHAQTDEEERDASGDIAPGSLEGPVMLPRAAAPESRTERVMDAISAILRRGDIERRRFAYEGKEAEMRRPEGMRHWDS